MESPPPPPAPSPAPSGDSGGHRQSSSPGPMPFTSHTYPSPPPSASHSDLSAFLSSPQQHAQFTFSLPVPVPFPMVQHHQQPFLYPSTTTATPALIDPSAMAMAAAAAAAVASGQGWPAAHAHAPQAVPIPLSPMDLASYQAAVHLNPQQPLLMSPNHLLQGHLPAPDACVAGNVLGPTAPAAASSTATSGSDRDHSPEPSSPTAASSSSSADRAHTQDPTCKRKPVIAMPELPSALEKRCKGGPGKKRKGISDEERMARQQDRVARNRIAAQESRNKKRAYVETLEAAAADLQESNAELADDNDRLRKRVRVLEEDNAGLAKKLDWVMAQMARVSGVQVPDEWMGSAAAAPPVQVQVPEPVPVVQQPVEQPISVPMSPSPNSDLITMSLADLTALIADGTSASPSLQMPSMFDFAALFAAPSSTPASASTSNGQLQAQPVPSSSSSSSSSSSATSSSPSSSSSSCSLPSASSTSTPGFPGPAAAGKLSAVPTARNSQQRRPRGARVFEAPPALSKMAAASPQTTAPATTASSSTLSTMSVVVKQAHLLPAWDSHWTLALAAMLKLMHWTLALATTWMRICSSHSLFEVLVGELTKTGHVTVEVARAIVAGVLQMDAHSAGVKTVVVQVPRALVDKLVGARRKVEGDRALAKRWGVYKKRPP